MLDALGGTLEVTIALARSNSAQPANSDEEGIAPDMTLTRAMFVTVIHRMEGTPEVAGNGNFTDVPSGNWYTAGVAWAVANQIVSGVGGGRFDPEGTLTQEQTATILYRYAFMKGYEIIYWPPRHSFSSAIPPFGGANFWVGL